MAGERWNDDRLDDLKRLVDANDNRLDKVEDVAMRHDEQFVSIAKHGDRRESRSWAIRAALITAAGSGVVNLIVTLLQHHK